MSPVEPEVHPQPRNVGMIFLWPSVALFAVSLILPAFYKDFAGNPRDAIFSFMLLFIGCCGPLQGLFSWYANPLLVVAWWPLGFGKEARAGFVCGMLALALALSFLQYGQILATEAGHFAPIVGYGPGYWLWIARIVTATVGCAVDVRKHA